MTDDQDFGTSQRTYVGRRNDANGKIVHAYLVDDDPEERWMKKPLLSGVAVGATITLTWSNAEHTTYWASGPKGPKITGFMLDKDQRDVLAWQMQDRAAYEVKSQADAMTRVIRESAYLDQHLDALADAARRMTASQRAAFARYVAERIR